MSAISSRPHSRKNSREELPIKHIRLFTHGSKIAVDDDPQGTNIVTLGRDNLLRFHSDRDTSGEHSLVRRPVSPGRQPTWITWEAGWGIATRLLHPVVGRRIPQRPAVCPKGDRGEWRLGLLPLRPTSRTGGLTFALRGEPSCGPQIESTEFSQRIPLLLHFYLFSPDRQRHTKCAGAAAHSAR